ncbi:MAG: hypothetical protein AAF633_21055, partial [Chloroflexota bacterium]
MKLQFNQSNQITKGPFGLLNTGWRLPMIGLLILLISAGVSASAVSQTVVNDKLSAVQPSEGGVGTGLRQIKISPDGKYAVYVDYQTVTGSSSSPSAGQLYSVPLDGSTPPNLLSDLLPEGINVLSFQISPNSDYVVYRHSQAADKLRLFSVSITGGTINALNQATDPNASIDYYNISPDGTYVIFTERMTNEATDSIDVDLYRIPIEGGAAVRLNDAQLNLAPALPFEISPDGAYIVFYVTLNNSFRFFDLYSVPVVGAGTENVKLNNTVMADEDRLGKFYISPNSRYVVYSIGSNPPDAPEFTRILRTPIE